MIYSVFITYIVQADIPSATQTVNQAIADQRNDQQKVVAAENANKTLTSHVETVSRLTSSKNFKATDSMWKAD